MYAHILDDACERVGTQRKLAEILGVTEAAVWQVRKGRRAIPARWCPLIEEATKGAIKCEKLRPDIKWQVLRLRSRRPRKAEGKEAE